MRYVFYVSSPPLLLLNLPFPIAVFGSKWSSCVFCRSLIVFFQIFILLTLTLLNYPLLYVPMEILAEKVWSRYVGMLPIAVADRRCPLRWSDINIACTYLIMWYSTESALSLALVLTYSCSPFYSHWSFFYKSCICEIYVVICKQALRYSWSKFIPFAFKAKFLRNFAHLFLCSFLFKKLNFKKICLSARICACIYRDKGWSTAGLTQMVSQK